MNQMPPANTEPPTPSRSSKLIAAMFYAALTALDKAPNGQLKKSQLHQAIASSVDLDDWATEIYDSGLIRWQSIFAFASIGLKRAGFATKQGGTWAITQEGRQVVHQPYDGQAFVLEVRRKYYEWQNSQLTPETKHKPTVEGKTAELEFDPISASTEGPQEGMAQILKSANEALAAVVIDEIKQCEPSFFEQLVVKLFLAMGYGGNQRDAGRSVGQSSDGGVEGIINEDPLGLDTIYLQAKCWQGSVGEGPVRNFIGALEIKGVKKGVFLTTSTFTPAAKQAISEIKSDKRIILIDGAHLAQLMIEHNLVVSIAESFVLKRLDTEFFENI